MWYVNAKRVLAQGLNVTGPAVPTPEMPNIPMPQMTPQNVETTPDQPAGTFVPPTNVGKYEFHKLHERCRCELKQLPSGYYRWVFAPNACDECIEEAKLFNREQMSMYERNRRQRKRLQQQQNPQQQQPMLFLPNHLEVNI